MTIAAGILLSVYLRPTSSRGTQYHQHSDRDAHHDPGPRAISIADRLAERIVETKKLGPYEEIGRPIWQIDKDTWVVRLPNGDNWFGRIGGRLRPDVITPLELWYRHSELVKALDSSLDHDEHDHCALSLNDRSPVHEKLAWSLIIHLSARNGTLVIDDVEGHGWPDQVDQEARDCYTQKFRGIEVPWPTMESLSLEYPICINPPPLVRVRQGAMQ